MTNLIAFTGPARSGKDTAASALVKLGYRRAAFADALKLATAMVANESPHLYFDDFAKEQHTYALGMTRRAALQHMGKGVRDVLGPDVWVNRLLAEWRSTGKPLTVISDCRYPNEALAIRAVGGIVVRINRPGAGLEGVEAQHESEARLPAELVDIELWNLDSAAELQAQVRKMWQNLQTAEHRESAL